MSKSLYSMVPDPEALLALEPEELAGVLLEYLNSLSDGERGQLNRYNFSLAHTFEGYPHTYYERLSRAFMEAWVWAEREGFIAPRPGEQGDWVFITWRGRRIVSATRYLAKPIPFKGALGFIHVPPRLLNGKHFLAPHKDQK